MNRITKAFMAKAYHMSNRSCTLFHRSICSAAATELVVKVTSKSFIKPSSPTPPKLRNFNLSILDQFFANAPIYPTFVFFYPPIVTSVGAGSTPLLLRDSFSETLSHFYPFAGRINFINEEVGTGISTINCNDLGAEYLEAEANQEMSHFLSTSPAPNTRCLAPPRPQQLIDTPLACVQTTVFRCGGIAVGVSLNHLITDGHVFSTLINRWAAIARGVSTNDMRVCAHDMASWLFPINDAVLSKPLALPPPTLDSSNKVVMPVTVLQRFVFKPEEISALKSRVKSSQVPNPSRTLAIFGLIWKAVIKAYTSASSGQGETKSSSTVLLPVNLRPRFKTCLPDYSIGNLLFPAKACQGDILVETPSSSHDDNDELKRLTYELKRSIDKVDTEFVENLKGEKGHKVFRKQLEARGHRKDYLFSSGIRIGLNEADFGMGKPIWVSFLGVTDIPWPDTAVLLEATPSDDTVEACVSLTEKEMAFFQRDPELLQYATVNPRVLV